jgi:carboxymethylenebutenolidase
MRPLIAVLVAGLAAGCASRTAPTPTAPAVAAEDVAYRSPKETLRFRVCRPPGSGPFPAVVVVHGDVGLTEWTKQQARRLAERGYLTLAVDLYRGEMPDGLMDAHILARGLPDDRVLDDLRAAVDYLAARADLRPDAIGIIGWDLGGGYALDAAIADPRLKAVVTCYGRLTTDPEVLKPLRASVLGIFGEDDEGIPRETIAQFETAMRKAGKRVAGVHVYPGCGHGFMDPASPGNRGPRAGDASAVAWAKIESYLDRELKD